MIETVNETWRNYFKDPYEGLGTTYERFILHRHLERIRTQYGVKTVLDVPSFGMTGISGINSMWLARQGASVTVVDHNEERASLIRRVWQKTGLEVSIVCQSPDYRRLPFEDKTFDMSWNFASLWFVQDLRRFLSELTRTTRKVILICIPNTSGFGHLIRRVLNRQEFAHLRLENFASRRIKKIMSSLDWVVIEQGLFDVPPWPDIAMKKEELLKMWRLEWVSRLFTKENTEEESILDYFSGKKNDMEKHMMRYGFLENSPTLVKRFWAHHCYLTFVPK